MNNIVEVAIPEWFENDELVALSTIVDKQDAAVGVLLAGDNLDKQRSYLPVVRVYLITLQNGKYEFAKEVSAFSFNSKEEAVRFTTKFSNYSTIELFVDLFKEQINIAI
ncbi:hypothetical protein [Ureibacillus sinduriensis]|uniref:Uncharacterized protein n=1 Tax=Ureibacillus sinduriensis BLB-1 = JCM 15800 TaxID=1384057 RepID=A0A0A3II32_9BACL|nr:hypothetical protein [Ureibacillus sinduriensis]KGR74517.1 hypothetical protein CD33_15585 [Ureibacillus sinduriensis BLB-1 = JCM 15800]